MLIFVLSLSLNAYLYLLSLKRSHVSACINAGVLTVKFDFFNDWKDIQVVSNFRHFLFPLIGFSGLVSGVSLSVCLSVSIYLSIFHAGIFLFLFCFLSFEDWSVRLPNIWHNLGRITLLSAWRHLMFWNSPCLGHKFLFFFKWKYRLWLSLTLLHNFLFPEGIHYPFGFRAKFSLWSF